MRSAPLALLALACATCSAHAQTTPRIESAAVPNAPEIDGLGVDSVWAQADPANVTVVETSDEGLGSEILVRSVHTETHVYVLVSWEDATPDATHKTWVWNSAEAAYEPGPDREDVLALAFEHTGEFNADMLSGEEGVWDVWQWKAARTDPAGHALDKTTRFSREQPAGRARPFETEDGDTIWISRPEDAGESPQAQQDAPSELTRERVPQYVAGQPTGSAADVLAKGTWQAGRWTVEFARRLNTGHVDDTAFAPGVTYRMGIAVFDHEEHGHHSASGVIELHLAP
ncbi:ethylbenzene dehydrogenase-related protein [Planctomycetota bacterium]|nr:ethylbenzene dehydrogenase-related protein [Planctomycetota bacterium]